MTSAAPYLHERLSRLDTCALSDALDALSLDGVVTGFRRWGARRRVVGRVTTVFLEPGPAPPGGRHLGTAALASARPEDVVVVGNGGRTGAAAWGGLLTLEAHLRDIAGIVVDGAVRDVDEVDALDVPVLARAATPRTARGRFHEAATDVTVTVGGIRVDPGDRVVADGSGIVFVRSGELPGVVEAAEEIAREEARMADALRAGRRGREVMDARYEGMLEKEPE